MNPTREPAVQFIAATVFAVALLHTFAAQHFELWPHRSPRHAGLFRLLGEVELAGHAGNGLAHRF